MTALDLPDRTAVRTCLSRTLAEATAAGRRVAVLFVDLDGLRAAGGHLGHPAADELVTAATRRLSRAVRPADTLARLADDEFLIVCHDTDRALASATAERVAAVLAQPFALSKDRRARLDACVGVALSDGTGDADRMLSAARRASARVRDERPTLGWARAPDGPGRRGEPGHPPRLG